MDNKRKSGKPHKKLKKSSPIKKKKKEISKKTIKKEVDGKIKKEDEVFLLFEKIFEHFPYAIAICDKKGRIVKTNKYFVDLFEAESTPDICIFDHPALKKAGYGKLLKKAQQGGYVEIPEMVYDVADFVPDRPSNKKYIRSISFAIYNRQKKISHYILDFENISDKKAIKEESMKSEEKYKRIFENIQDVYFESSLEGKLIEVSGSVETFTKYKREELLGMNILNLYADPLDREKMLIELGLKGSVRNYILKLKDKDGSVICSNATLKLILDSKNRPERIVGSLVDISEYNKTLEALKVSEERYREIFENANEMICTSDLDGNIVSINPAFEKNLGYRFEDNEIKNLQDFLTENSVRIVRENIKNKIEHPGESSIFEIEAIAKNGHHVFFEVSCLLKYKDNQPNQILGIARNITERKKTEDELNKTREKYRELFDSTNDIIYTMDFKGNFTSVNKTAEKLLGLKFDELADVNMRSYLTPESARRALTDVVRKLRGKDENTVYEVDFIKKNRGIVTFEINSQVRYIKGKPYEVFGIARDVTERKKANEALKNSEEKYRMIFENAPLGIMTADISGNIIEINPVLLQMLGSKSIQETKSINVLSFPPMIMAGLVEKFVKCIETGEAVISEHSYTSKWGMSLDTRIYTKPIKNIRGKIIGFQTIVEDITEQKKTEKQIKSTLNEKEVLIREIHHRVKNNMQIIISLINMQMQDSNDVIVIKKFRELQHRVRSMSIIHEDLYMSDDLSRINFGNYLERLTNHLLQAYPHKSNLQLKFNVSDVLLGIDIAIPCGLIVNELVSNSLKYAFPEHYDYSKKQYEIFVEFYTEKNKYKLIIGDNGIGFPPDIEEIKAKSLGLQLVEILVNQLKGVVKMSVKKGARFEIDIEKEKEKK